MSSSLSRHLQLSAALPLILYAAVATGAVAQNGNHNPPPTPPSPPAGDVTISATVNGSLLQISANPNAYAGAVDSIYLGGTQFVQNYQHGQSFQSDTSYDNASQCYNPTEAGSQNDGSATTSSSVLQSISNSNNVLTTQTNMTFWLAPGQQNTNGVACGSNINPVTNEAITNIPNDIALNTTFLANHILTKKISIGTNGIANLVSVNQQYYIPISANSGQFFFNGYMPAAFNTSLSYDPSTKTLSLLQYNSTTNTTGWSFPIITSSADGSNAVGVISTQSPQAGYAYGYLPENINGTATHVSYFACNLGVPNVQAGSTQNLNCQLAFGNVDQDISALNAYYGTTDVSIPIYRFRKAPYMIWTNTYSYGAALWGSGNFNGVAYRVNPQGISGSTTALYSCLRSNSSADYFVSISSSCEGQTVLGVLGYASPAAGNGLTPLYRFYNASLGIHLITISYNEGTSAGGFAYNTTLGYVPTT